MKELVDGNTILISDLVLRCSLNGIPEWLLINQRETIMLLEGLQGSLLWPDDHLKLNSKPNLL